MNSRTWRTPLLALLALSALAVTGCSDDDDDGGIIRPPMGDGAKVRVVHASPDAPNVDVYVEGVAQPLITDLGYTETSAYLDVDPGDYNIQLRAAGAPAASAPAFETGTLTIPADATITAVAVGLLSSGDAPDAFRVLPLVEDFAAPGAGNAAVRIVHAGSDAPTVALDVGADGTPEITDFARFAETGADGVPLPAGSGLSIAVWAGSPLARVTSLTTPALPAGANLFVIATGLLSQLPREEAGFGLLAVGPAGTIGLVRQDPVVFALHASPDAPAVDIFAGGAELVDNLAFGELSAPVQVAPGAYDLSFRAHDDGPVAATVTTPELQAGQRYLAVASGFLGKGDFALLPFDEGFQTAGYDALVSVVHASPDAPAVDVGLWDGMAFTPVPALSDLAYGERSAASGLDLGVASLTLGVAQTGTTTPVATFDVATVAGLRAFAVAAGSLADASAEGFRLLLVDTQNYPWQMLGQVFPNP